MDHPHSLVKLTSDLDCRALIHQKNSSRVDWFHSQEPGMDASASSPVFVFGALRSGTTLFRLMLDSHPQIANPGEVDFIFEYLRQDGVRYAYDVEALRLDRVFRSYHLVVPNVTDGKEAAREFIAQFRKRTSKVLSLNIHRNLDKVVATFPSARLIHLVRDPRDVARSCIGMGWAGNAYFGVDQWIDTERNWDDCVTFFPTRNVMQLRYEDLISSPLEELEKVCSFLGLNFSPEMLNYPNHTNYQAPKPAAIFQWKSDMSEEETAFAEFKAKRLLLARNYELSGFPLRAPNLFERLQLLLSNKTYKWRFACRRYGFFNVIMEKLTRAIFFSLHAKFALRINEIDERYLK